MTRTVLILLTALVLFPATAEVRTRTTEIPDDARLEKVVKLNLIDADVREVLDLMFRTAEVPAEIDPCVAGSVTIETEGVSVRDSLKAMAHMVEFEVVPSPRSDGYLVVCPGQDPYRETVELRFRLVRVDGNEETKLASPTLLTRTGQAAEIMVGSRTPRPDVDRQGLTYERRTLSQLSVKALALPPREDGTQVLRGVLRISGWNLADDDVTRVAMKGFEVTLPPDDEEILAAEVTFDGKEHRLFVSRPER